MVATIFRPGAEALFAAPHCKNILDQVLFSIERAGTELATKGRVSKSLLKMISSGFNISKKSWRQGANLAYWLKTKESVMKE